MLTGVNAIAKLILADAKVAIAEAFGANAKAFFK